MRSRHCPGLSVAAVLLAGLSAGCGQRASLELTSYRDPYFPEQLRLRINESTYQPSGGRNYRIAARSRSQDEQVGPVEQFLCVHVFWHPRPGKTFDHKTAIDATLRYAIRTEQGSAIYHGTGYVYVQPRKLLGYRLSSVIVLIEDARMRLEATSGEPPLMLGDVRLVGSLLARRSDPETVELFRKVERMASNADRVAGVRWFPVAAGALADGGWQPVHE